MHGVGERIGKNNPDSMIRSYARMHGETRKTISKMGIRALLIRTVLKSGTKERIRGGYEGWNIQLEKGKTIRGDN